MALPMTELAEWRKARGITQEALAERLGLSARQLQRIEAGHSRMKRHMALALLAIE